MNGHKAQPGAPPPEASSSATRLRGHLGHLTAEEEAAFKTFKEQATQTGYYKPASASAKASHDDGTLIRYLRARNFAPQEAYNQFSETEDWRKNNDLVALYEKFDIEDYRESRSVYPQWTGRRDKRGLPVYLYEIAPLNSKKMAAYSSSVSKSDQKGAAPTKMLRLFALYENLTRFVMPLCSSAPGRPHPETPVDQSNNICDISNVGLKQFWNLKGHMQDASTLATAHYPETLDRVFIIGAPSFFPTVWGWIKRWFDPITTSKIFILAHHEVLPTLQQFIDIENIPKKFGGKLEFVPGDKPNLDDTLRDCLTISPNSNAEDYFLTAPVRWMDAGDDGEMKAMSVGSINGLQRSEQVAVLHSAALRNASHADRLSRISTRNSAAPSADAVVAHVNGAMTLSSETTNGQPPVAAMAGIKLNGNSTTAATTAENGSVTGKHPDHIDIPPPADLERQETEFVTPPSDPSEIKTLQ